MPRVFEHFHTALAEEIDQLGHVNNLAYLRWMLSAAAGHSSVQGWTTERYQQLGAAWVVRSHEIKYLASAFEGERIVVRTWVADLKHFSCLRKYKIVRVSDHVLLASATTEWAFVDTKTGTLKRIPAEVLDAFEVVPQGSPTG